MRRKILSIIAVTAAAIAGSASAEVAFRPLGFLPGESSSRAEGISADGAAIVGYGSGGAFRWTEAGGMVPLGSLPSVSPSSQALAASHDGSIVVGFSSIDGLPEAVRWTPQGIEELGYLSATAPPVSWADDVSDDGSLVVGRGWTEAVPGGVEAFRWTPASGMVGLGVLPDHSDSWARAVSADGSVVVGSSTQVLAEGNPAEAFRWTESSDMESLGFLPAPADVAYRSSTAYAASADGSVIFGTAGLHYTDGSPSSNQMFRWTPEGGMVGLGVRPALVRPAATNADGTVAVGVTQIPDGEAMLWDRTYGHRELDRVLARYGVDISGWTRTSATDISADGTRVVGYGRNPSGQTEAWMATLPPPGPECLNDFDDDGDGFVDLDDPGCPTADAALEDPLCDDGLDNDGDGLVDFADPTCSPEWPYWEQRPCGLGFELAGLIPLAVRFRRRSARRAA